MVEDILRELEDVCNMTSCEDCIIRDVCKKYLSPHSLSDFCEEAALKIEEFEKTLKKEGA